MKLFHLNIVTAENSDKLNREGWSVEPWATHADITMLGDRQKAAAAFIEGAYIHVAELTPPSRPEPFMEMEWAYQETQNLHEEGWAQAPAPGVSPIGSRLRSTSVGDIIFYEDFGRYFFCASIGWTPMVELNRRVP